MAKPGKTSRRQRVQKLTALRDYLQRRFNSSNYPQERLVFFEDIGILDEIIKENTMVILNFSHPLSDTALKQIQDLYMGEYLQEVIIPVQVDLNQPLPPQIESIYSQAEPYLDTGVALVVVPSLAVIAALLMSRLSATTPGVIHLVVLKRDPASFGGQFVLAGTVAY